MENKENISKTPFRYHSVVVREAFPEGQILRNLLTAPQNRNAEYAAIVEAAVQPVIDVNPTAAGSLAEMGPNEEFAAIDENWLDEVVEELCRDGAPGVQASNVADEVGEDHRDGSPAIENDGVEEMERPTSPIIDIELMGLVRRSLRRSVKRKSSSLPRTPRSNWSQASSDLPSVGSSLDVEEAIKKQKQHGSPAPSLPCTVTSAGSQPEGSSVALPCIDTSMFSQPEEKKLAQQRSELVIRLLKECEECKQKMKVTDKAVQEIEKDIEKMEEERRKKYQQKREATEENREARIELKRKLLKLKALRS